MSDCGTWSACRVLEPRLRSPGGPGQGRKEQDHDLLSSCPANPVGGRILRGTGTGHGDLLYTLQYFHL